MRRALLALVLLAGVAHAQPFAADVLTADPPADARGMVVRPIGGGGSFDGVLKDGTGDTTQANVTSGRLHVDGSGVTQPVSGTVTVQDGGNVITVDGTVTVGTFPDNEPFNLSQIAGSAPGAGNPLPVRQSDGSGFIDAREVEGQNNARPIFCTSTAFLNMSSATTTQIVALSGSTHIYVCSFAVMAGGTASVKLVSGTGSNCATSPADVSPNYPLVAQSGINRTAGGGNVVARTNDTGDALCATSSAAVTVTVEVSYAQF